MSKEELRKIIFNYELPLGARLTAWQEWCKLFDEQEAAKDVERDVCKSYAL